MSALSPEDAELALCRNKGPYPWITPENCDKDTYNRAAVEARAICDRCPVQKQCRVAGLLEVRGTWGGVSYRERNQP